ncbi:MAG: Membrane protein [Mucilaginibacter sp.]|uniref:hypothetical protein n=1 Tax=Mucilaginibacter sp. TaxID=1882438 RepID=UPI00262CF3B0|nr:hypothetical protein [Mucilaginibacter sp.]MDB5002308.1 Membrane protein [Mucilaginibacter sp.]
MDNKILLYINIMSLIMNMWLIFISYKRNKLINLIYHFVFLFLVTGQSLNISINLQEDREVYYHSNRITGEGHLISSFFIFYCMVIFYLFEYLYKKRRPSKNIFNSSFKKNKQVNYSIPYYVVNWIVFFLMSFSMVALIGFNEIIDEGRPGGSGSTFLLIVLSLCIYPFIIKIINNSSINYKETTLFIGTFFITVLFSRMIAIFHLMMVVVAGYYSVYNKYRTPLSKYKKYFITVPIILVIFFFGFGTYRNLKNFNDASGLSFNELLGYIKEHPENTLFSIDVNYKLGIEGISGLSGLMTQFCENPFIKIDGGLSIFSAFITLIPSFFRGVLLPLQEFLLSLYWYKGSIVSSGIEASYVHFSFLGLLGYPVFLSWYFNSLNKKVSSKIYSGINLSSLTSYVLIIYGLLIIRGSSSACIFFIIANLVIAKFSTLIYIVFNNKSIPKNKSDSVINSNLHLKD